MSSTKMIIRKKIIQAIIEAIAHLTESISQGYLCFLQQYSKLERLKIKE